MELDLAAPQAMQAVANFGPSMTKIVLAENSSSDYYSATP
jgi:hypothetical protein